MTGPEPIPDFREDAGEGRQALSAALASSFRFLRVLAAVLAVLYLASGVFRVEQNQVAYVLRAGRPVADAGRRQLGPGVHWTWPRPFSEIVRVDASGVQTLETQAFLADPFAAPPPPGPDSHTGHPNALHPVRHGYAVSGDLNIVHTRCVLRYTLSDPWAATFGVSNLRAVLAGELDHAVTRTAAARRADELLRTDVDAWRLEIAETLRARCARLGLGVRIEGVDLSPAIPAQIDRETQAVTEAASEAARTVAEARGAASRIGGEAAAEAAALEADARTWSTRLAARAGADASTFAAFRERHAADPATLEDILLQETLGRVLRRVEEKFVLREDAGGELRLTLPRHRKDPPPGGHAP